MIEWLLHKLQLNKEHNSKRVAVSLLLLVLLVFLFGSFFSFYFTWKFDQSVTQKDLVDVILQDKVNPVTIDSSQNFGSSLGFYLAQFFIHDTFGVASFGFVFLLAYLLIRIWWTPSKQTDMAIRKKENRRKDRKIFINTICIILLLSITLGFFCNDLQDCNFCGNFGYQLAYVILPHALGSFMTGFLIICAIFMYVCVAFKPKFLNKLNTINFFNKKQENVQQTQTQQTTQEQQSQVEPVQNTTEDVEETTIEPIETSNEQQESSEHIETEDVHQDEETNDDSNDEVVNEDIVIPTEEDENVDNEQQESLQEDNEDVVVDSDDVNNEDVENQNSSDVEDDETNVNEQETSEEDEKVEIPKDDDSTEESDGDVDDDDEEEEDDEKEEDDGEKIDDSESSQKIEEEDKKPEIEIINTNNIVVENPKEKIVLQDYDPKADLSHFKMPGIDLLKVYDNDINTVQVDEEEILTNKNLIEKTLSDFKIEIENISATVGPTITLYEIVPKAGTRISKIQSLEKDIMMSLEALGIRIIAPIPGKGSVGIEVPNKVRQTVSMYSVINSQVFKESKMELPVALGKTITNDIYMFDLAKTPHLLVAGATGQGKSVGLNAIITSLLYKKHPSQLKFVLVDPKMVEFSIYSGLIKHYMAQYPGESNIIITECEKAKQTLDSLVQEMEDRYTLLMEAHCRNIIEYNGKFIHRQLNPQKGHKFLPYIVIIIDEFGDFIMQVGKEIETPIARIAQKARAVGMHLILATQRPSVNVITGIIKANIPSRMAFKTSARIDSQTILDTPGAEGLVGRGDLLISASGGKPERVQCAFVDTPEVERIVSFIEGQQGYDEPLQLPEISNSKNGGDAKSGDKKEYGELDSLIEDAAHFLIAQNSGSTSSIQRAFEVGYNRAGRIMDQLESLKIVGPAQGSKPRDLLVDSYGLESILTELRNTGKLK